MSKQEQQKEDSVCGAGAGRGRGGGESLFCSLLSRAAGEFQRASRDSQVNTTLPGSCQGWPQTLPTWRVAWQLCRGAILHLPPITKQVDITEKAISRVLPTAWLSQHKCPFLFPFPSPPSPATAVQRQAAPCSRTPPPYLLTS